MREPVAARPAARTADEPSLPASLTPAGIVLLATWVGLIAGFLDLGLLVFKARVIDGDFYRLGPGFPWIVPVGVAALVVLPGAALALVARVRRSVVSTRLAVGLPGFLGFLDVCSRLPLHSWASLLLSGGLAVQCARLVGRRDHAVLRFARWTTPLLAGSVLAIAVSITVGRVGAEYRATAALPPAPRGRANVLLIVWDTVRARNLSLHGYGRRTTPSLERLAAQGVRFEHAFATSSWTLPSHASLFTGRWAHELTAGWRSPLDGTHPTLAGYLRSLGYDTAGFVANLDYCGRETGLDRGFTHYEDYPLNGWEVFTRYVGLGRRIDWFPVALVLDKLMGGRGGASSPLVPLAKEHAKRGAEVDRAFLDWLSRRRARNRPFFAFLNYVDAHSPYEVPDPQAPAFGLRPSSWRDLFVLTRWISIDKRTLTSRDVQLAIDLYDDSIAYLDARLGKLLDELRRRGVLDDTLVIVTSDHGEHLGDHLLFFHGGSLYRQLLEVPLVIVPPGGEPAGRVVDEPVSLRDVPATVVDLLGLETDSPFPGQSLARFGRQVEGASPPGSGPLLAETGQPPILANQGREPAAKGPMRSVVAGGMHYIRSADGREELFSLSADPDERVNVAGLPQARTALEGFRAILRTAPRGLSP